MKDGDIWVNFYFGYGKIYEDGHSHAQEGLALSADLLHWEKVREPILSFGPEGTYYSGHVHKASIVKKMTHCITLLCNLPWKEGDPTEQKNS